MDTLAHGNFGEAGALRSGKRLVVFGAGYVGGALARDAVARGMRVVALTRNAEKARALAKAGVEVIVAELASSAWHAQIGAAELAVNCVSAGGGGIAGYRESYVAGMRSILEWSQKRASVGAGAGEEKRRRHFVYTSSTSVYPQSGGAVVRESDPTAPNADEKAQILREAETLALRVPGGCVLRLAGIYGPGRHHLIDQLRAGARTFAGQGEQHVNMIHRDDAVRAIWAVLQTSEPARAHGKIFNVCDDHAASRAEVIGWLAEQLGLETLPLFSGVAAEGRRGSLLDRVICNKKIKTQLGWQPHFASFREGYAASLHSI